MLKDFRNELIFKIKLYQENLNNTLISSGHNEQIQLFDEYTKTIIDIVTEVEKLIWAKDVHRRETKD